MTKLGIVVVYLVNEDNEKLLDLHFRQIERHTHVPYTIYGSANRLLPKFRPILERHQVRICDCPTTDLRGQDEHSFYLEQLIQIALDEGATHVVTLHVDSFPVRSDWAETLIGKLTGKCVLASIMRDAEADQKPSTACLLFRRDFYLTYHPTLLITDAEWGSAEFERYRKEFTPETDSGIGYGFKVFTKGLEWYPLVRSNTVEDYFAYSGIYGELIFHLGGATWFLGDSSLTPDGMWARLGTVPLFHQMKKLVKQFTPPAVRSRLPAPVKRKLISPMLEQRKRDLLDDPDSFLEYLGSGKPR